MRERSDHDTDVGGVWRWVDHDRDVGGVWPMTDVGGVWRWVDHDMWVKCGDGGP